MYKTARPEEFHRPPKVMWNRLSLQCLTFKKFVEVTNKILRGEYRLLKD